MLLERDAPAQVTNRRGFLAAAIAGASALAVPASIMAVAASPGQPQQLPPALRQAFDESLADIYRTATYVSADVRHEQPGWHPTVEGLRAYIEEESHLRVERIPGSTAFVGYSEYSHEERRAHCVLYLPDHLAPELELRMLAWGLAYHWRCPSDEAYHRCPLPSTYGLDPLETAYSTAVLDGLLYSGPDVLPWKLTV